MLIIPTNDKLILLKDCESGGTPKAQTAAESLKQIFPGVNSCGINLSIPMPGHSVQSEGNLCYVGHNCHSLKLILESKVLEDIAVLEKLICSSDVVFLLMDTRESRWLPTLMCSANSKLCVNAALGFDTYMVMRHGLR